MASSLVARSVVKRYGGVVALADAHLQIRAGEVLALVGANGSGKSTLSKIINGVVGYDDGELLLDGEAVRFASPHQARARGIATVFQELSLVPQMTVAENIWLTHEPLRSGGTIDHGAVRRRTEELLNLFRGTYGSDLEPNTLVGPLPPDEKQIVEILKAVSFDPRILILDEATASLDSRQVGRLFDLVRRWKEAGTAVIFVSHRMEEIKQIADRYTVLRNGKTVGEGAIRDTTADALVSLMVGGATAEKVSEHQSLPAEELRQRPVLLDVQNVRSTAVHGVSFQLHQGELLGLGGLRGQGQHQLLLALFGALPYTGEVAIDGTPARFRSPREAMRRGLALVPGERAREGLLLIRSILENILLPSWRSYGFPLRIGRARDHAEDVGARLNLKMGHVDDPVSSLSGGNAQKVVIGKWLLRDPRILMLDDPTKGIDVGAKAEFYKLLTHLCAEGKSVLLYSSDDEELIGLCDRVLVMHDGRVAAELAGPTLTKEHLVSASLGASEQVSA